ncbi:hypothetical protein T492DRAFT_878660, partial [Pavlovales sp. CCMP2436]
STDVSIATDITLVGTSYDRFIFQVSGNLVVDDGKKLVADGTGFGAPTASNIIWQVTGNIAVGVGSHLEGTLLVKTHAAFKAGSSLNGRILAQTAATLISTTIVAPLTLPSLSSPPPAPPPTGISTSESA